MEGLEETQTIITRRSRVAERLGSRPDAHGLCQATRAIRILFPQPRRVVRSGGSAGSGRPSPGHCGNSRGIASGDAGLAWSWLLMSCDCKASAVPGRRRSNHRRQSRRRRGL